MSDNLKNLEQVYAALLDLGYMPSIGEAGVHLEVNGFVTVMTISEALQRLDISCQLAKVGDVPEDELPAVMYSMLDANTRTRPYAFEILSAQDTGDDIDIPESPIVLADSLPLGDLCVEELKASVESLAVAIATAVDTLELLRPTSDEGGA
jgi:hypothetical protein